MNDDQIVDEPKVTADAAQSVPAKWVRTQLTKIGKTARAEVQALRRLEQQLRSYRVRIQEFAIACEKGGQEGTLLLPAVERVRRARDQRLAQGDKVQGAKTAQAKSEGATASELVRLMAIIPWNEGMHGMQDRVDVDPPQAKRKR